MSFSAGYRAPPVVNRHGIDAAEYDGIVAALKASPGDIDRIAQTFNRSPTTIDKIRERVGIARERLPCGSAGGRG